MVPFHTGGQAVRLGLTISFAHYDYANISFFDAAEARIPFHVSLRQRTGLIVFNKRASGGDSWSREKKFRADLKDRLHQLELRFDAATVSVWLNGRKITSFGARPLIGPAYPDLGSIRRMDVQGGVPMAGAFVSPGLDLLPLGEPTLTERLEVAVRVPGNVTAPGIEIDGTGLTFPGIARPLAGTGDHEVTCLLPGRIWRNTEADSVEAIIKDGARELARLRVSKTQVAERMASVLSRRTSDIDVLQATQIIEHVRFGGLLDAVPDPGAVHRLANVMRLTSFLEADAPPVEVLAPPPAPVVPSDPPADADDDERREAAFVRLSEWLRTHEGVDDDSLRARLAAIDLPKAGQADVALRAAHWFCRTWRVPLLSEFLTAPGMPPFWTGSDDLDYCSRLLPVLWYLDRFDDLEPMLWRVADSGEWINSGCLAHVALAAIAAPEIPPARRRAALYAVKSYVDRTNGDYWNVKRTDDLIDVAASTIASGDRLPAYLLSEMTEWALRNYGLSKTFWTMLEARGGPAHQDGVVRDAAIAFNRIAVTRQADAATEDALVFFERFGNRDAAQTRLELFGPAGVANPDAHPRLTGWPDRGNAVVRSAAAPGTDIEIDEDDLYDAAMTIGQAYSNGNQTPHAHVQHAAGRYAKRLADAEPLTDADHGRGIADLMAIAGSEAGFTGLALGASLIRTLATRDPERVAAIAYALGHRIDAMDSEDASVRDRHAGTETARALLHMIAEPTAPVRRLIELLGPPESPAPRPADALFNTMVVVFSCRPNLETRIKAIRETWMADLKSLGVPVIVVVGGGDGTLREDGVVELDAPDDYEGLPQKTLAAIRWVFENTGATHLFKVDDDCFLNAEEVMLSLSHLGADYYGRRLPKFVGDMDRTWHTAKSTSDRGRFEVDKSPEPSVYCDGGSGYALSRRAMGTALGMLETPLGQRLVQTSLMEDKMVGDLLSLGGIEAVDTDYRVSMRRNLPGDPRPVTHFVDGFDPSRAAPTKLVHLDTHLPMADLAAGRSSRRLTPKKIWPTYGGVALGWNSNALEYLGSDAALEAAREARVAVVAVVRNEMFMLPHFLKHYRALGVTSFLVADNLSDDGSREYLLAQPDVALFSAHSEYRYSHYGVAWQQALLGTYRTGKWTLLADADELLVPSDPALSGGISLPQLATRAEAEGADAYRVFMVDLYPGGPLSEATLDGASPFEDLGFCERDPFLATTLWRGPFWDQPTWTSALRHRLIPAARQDLFVAQKIALLKYRPWHRLCDGLHYVSDVALSETELIFGHLKYNADFRRRAIEEVGRRQHFNDAEEYRKYLALASEGREVVHDPGISVPWRDCAFVANRLISPD